MKTIDEADLLISAQNIAGWCPKAQGVRLYQAAAALPSGSTIVEVGSFKGLSLAWLGFGAGKEKRLISVDPGDPEYDRRKGIQGQTLKGNMEALGIEAEYIKELSTDAALKASDYGISSESVSMLYIDACHDYENVREDFYTWKPLLEPGAVVVFDDYTRDHPGVVKCVTELIEREEIIDAQFEGHALFSVLGK